MPLTEYIDRLQQLSGELDVLENKRKKVLDFMSEAPVICFMKDSETGRYQFMNQKGVEAFGMPEDQIIGKTDLEIFPKIIADQSVLHDLDVLRDKKPSVSIELRRFGDNQSKLYLISRFLVVNGGISIGGLALEVPDTFRLEPIKKGE